MTSTSGANRTRTPRRACAEGAARAVGLGLAVLALLGAAMAPPARAGENPIGAHSMLQLDDPPSFMEAMFAQAAAMHAAAIRLDVAPALIFTSPSHPPDFSGLDEVVALAQSYHLRVVADLLTVPAWMAQCATPTNTPTRCATDDLSGYGSVIAQIVRRADPIIRDWEVWNEPDTGEFFNGTPQQYAFMLRAAHDAITSVDPADNTLLGGVSGVSATSWLAQVLATPGADAVHAFDTANLHERGDLWQLAPDVTSFRRFLAAEGFGGPLWVTEHGYPADPQYQYDPGYTGGEAAQAAYLQASVPTLIDAGAAEVFVTERDNLTGPFASEGVLSGDVTDPPPADPQIVARPAFAVVQAIADCYQQLGRECPSAPATAFPTTAILPPSPPGQASVQAVTVSNPGAVPIVLGSATVGGPFAAGLSVVGNPCVGMVLEPRETCTLSLRFAPAASGDASGTLELASDDGTLDVPLVATAPSLSGLLSPDLPHPRFVDAGAGNGVGYAQRWRLTLVNPFRAAVTIARPALTGVDAARFRVGADGCATLRPYGSCRLTLSFTPTRPGMAQAQLDLTGTGLPLTVPLGPVAYARPVVSSLVLARRHGCVVRPGTPVSARITQPATLRWTLARARLPRPGGCPRAGAPGATAAAVAAGTVRTDGRGSGAAARWALPAHLSTGGYVLTIWAVNGHGVGRSRAMAVRLAP